MRFTGDIPNVNAIDPVPAQITNVGSVMGRPDEFKALLQRALRLLVLMQVVVGHGQKRICQCFTVWQGIWPAQSFPAPLQRRSEMSLAVLR